MALNSEGNGCEGGVSPTAKSKERVIQQRRIRGISRNRSPKETATMNVAPSTNPSFQVWEATAALGAYELWESCSSGAGKVAVAQGKQQLWDGESSGNDFMATGTARYRESNSYGKAN